MTGHSLTLTYSSSRVLVLFVCVFFSNWDVTQCVWEPPVRVTTTQQCCGVRQEMGYGKGSKLSNKQKRVLLLILFRH